MDRILATLARSKIITINRIPDEIRVEFYRKSIHLLVAIVPFLATIHLHATIFFLAAGVVSYSVAEVLRMQGTEVLIISRITVISSRSRDEGHFVLGPVTLAIGAMLALLLYPEPAASIAIFALAFGDGFSSLIGKLFRSTRIPLTGGKTVAGSGACFFSVLIATLSVTGTPGPAIVIAIAATAFEALPTQDLDNILLPVGTGIVALQLVPIVG